MTQHDKVKWHARWKIEKFDGEYFEGAVPFDVIEIDGNLLLTAGATALWTALTGGSITVFSSANAYIGVGDSTTAASAGQTDLQASTNKLRKAMDATYPSVSSASCVFKSTFTTSDANWTWNEWGVFNASSSGTMLNRKVENLGTKTSAASWAVTCTLTLA
jgi:hypothetical protein